MAPHREHASCETAWHAPLTADDRHAPAAPRVLLLPGWQDSDASHWQSIWESTHGFERVVQDDWQWPRRGDWMARLDDVVQADARPTVLVAHSLGCLLVDAWASHSPHIHRVIGALLVAPPDTTRDDTPPQLHNWRAIAGRPLPFPSIVVYSDDDPYASAHFSKGVARCWGSQSYGLGQRGHVNGASGLGDWPFGLSLLNRLTNPCRVA